MAQFKAFDPNVEVRGDVVLSTINVMGAFKRIAIGILEDHGILDLQPHRLGELVVRFSSTATVALAAVVVAQRQQHLVVVPDTGGPVHRRLHDRLGAQPRRIREDQPNLKLSVDLDAMSADERTQAATALRSALDRIAGPD